MDADEANRLEGAIEGSDGVGWAAYNGVLGRVVVSFDPKRIKLSNLIGLIEQAEQQIPEPEPSPGIPDVDPNIANAVVLGADLLGAGVGLIGRAVHLPRLPAEFAGLPVALDLLPRLGNGLRGALGTARTDLGLALLSSGIGAATANSVRRPAEATGRSIFPDLGEEPLAEILRFRMTVLSPPGVAERCSAAGAALEGADDR